MPLCTRPARKERRTSSTARLMPYKLSYQAFLKSSSMRSSWKCTRLKVLPPISNDWRSSRSNRNLLKKKIFRVRTPRKKAGPLLKMMPTLTRSRGRKQLRLTKQLTKPCSLQHQRLPTLFICVFILQLIATLTSIGYVQRQVGLDLWSFEDVL